MIRQCRRNWRMGSLAFLAIVIGCGSGGGTPAVDTGTSAQDGSASDLGSTDLGGADVASDDSSDTLEFDTDIGSLPELPGGQDTQAGEVVDNSGCDFVNAKPGECGFSCVDDGKCLSGFCVPTRDDRVCTKVCNTASDCPVGWTCRELTTAPDVLFGCVPASLNLGRPCEGDLDCVSTIGQTIAGVGDLCVPQGDAGAFCGADCSSGQACPDGFACKTVKSLTGKLAKQCVANDVSANCTQRFVFEAAQTKCATSNAMGSCQGVRHCDTGPSGKVVLVPCDAPAPASETCNLKDDNCNGVVDEPVPGAICQISSGDLACPGTPICAGGVLNCIGPKPAPESCNGQDDNCNGQTDEGCDKDGDGFCDAAMLYDPSTKACKNGGGDCNDQNSNINPKQKEVCDGVDNDCNGSSDAQDPGLLLTDTQLCEVQKGVCAGAKKPASLCVAGKWMGCADSEYQANNPAFSNAEVCDDKDNDCSGAADEGCDDDKDSYCDAAMATIGFPLVCAKGGGDCLDTSDKVHPGAQEVCDDLDNNCNSSVDEYCDKDSDGYCDANLATSGKPKACVNGGGDCDDLNKGRNPGQAELCNGQDDNCDGKIDENFASLGNACQAGQGACLAAGKTVCAADGSSAVCSVQPGVSMGEICDNVDNNCNGQVDEGCDDDADGYCDSAMATAGFPTACKFGGGDCNDLLGSVHPGAPEVCNGKDDDCDGKTDAKDGDLAFDDAQPCEKQAGVCKGSKKDPSLCVDGKWTGCTAPDYGGWSGSFEPVEIMCDNLDNNCDGQLDEGCDDDADGYCDANMGNSGASICKFTAIDCDDTKASVHPNADEVCNNVDDDCNYVIDDKCDGDGDGYCNALKDYLPPAGGIVNVCAKGGNDCDDSDPTVNPGKKDVCADFIDNNCNGITDDGCAPTTLDFSGSLGPNYATEGLLQCAGYQDDLATDDIPPNWGAKCAGGQWNRIRVVCGPSPNLVRYIDVKQNVFKDGLPFFQAYGLIYNANFDLGDNLIKSDYKDLSAGRSWWVKFEGCDDLSVDPLYSLTVNNGSCKYEASNCFGQKLPGTRYLYVYVGK